MSDWYLVGLYYEKYTPFFSFFGVKVMEGYFNVRTKKYKLVNKWKTRMSSSYEQQEIVERMELDGYRPKHHFLIDIAEINIKIHDKMEGR